MLILEPKQWSVPRFLMMKIGVIDISFILRNSKFAGPIFLCCKMLQAWLAEFNPRICLNPTWKIGVFSTKHGKLSTKTWEAFHQKEPNEGCHGLGHRQGQGRIRAVHAVVEWWRVDQSNFRNYVSDFLKVEPPCISVKLQSIVALGPGVFFWIFGFAVKLLRLFGANCQNRDCSSFSSNVAQF